MGCDIHSYVEKKNQQGEWEFISEGVFDNRSYGTFGFLGDVRNYSETEFLQKDRGIPNDVSETVALAYEDWAGDAHSAGWLLLSELLSFDYDKQFYNMRVMRNNNGAARARTLEEAQLTTYRDFLCGSFFEELEYLKNIGAPLEVRIVFWFDN